MNNFNKVPTLKEKFNLDVVTWEEAIHDYDNSKRYRISISSENKAFLIDKFSSIIKVSSKLLPKELNPNHYLKFDMTLADPFSQLGPIK